MIGDLRRWLTMTPTETTPLRCEPRRTVPREALPGSDVRQLASRHADGETVAGAGSSRCPSRTARRGCDSSRVVCHRLRLTAR